MRRLSIALLFIVGLCTATAARLPGELLVDSETAPAGLRNSAQGLLNAIRGVERHKGKQRAYASVRFIVPPSESHGFEDAWIDLEKQVMKKEKEVEIFDLKKNTLDNLIYLSYGEWSTMRGLHDYLTAKHFEEFADYVDDHGIRWQLEVLKSLSKDIEEEERTKGLLGRHSRRSELSYAALASLPKSGVDADESVIQNLWREVYRHRDMAHMLITYLVTPGEGEGFVGAWRDAAEETIKEKGNRIYSLRKVASDNTRYYAYGTWDSMRDYLDHFESEHVGKLLDYTKDNNIVYFIQPLTKIGNQPE